jgi:hypothetical protein
MPRSPSIIALSLSLALLLTGSAAYSTLGNSVEENKSKYGEPILIESYPPGNKGFNGYITYSVDPHWKIVTYYISDKARSEHLIPKRDPPPEILNKTQVQNWAAKMFPANSRGSHRRQLNMPRVEGHFFSRGMVAYEYNIVGKAVKGFLGLKVLLYEDDKDYSHINPKAYI